MDKKIFFIGLCTLIAIILFSCTNSNASKLKMMQSTKIKIPYEEMTCWLNDSMLVNRPWESERANKYIVYIDSSLCSSCNIKKLYHWHDLMEKYSELRFVFILAPHKKKDAPILPGELHKSNLNHPIYIDKEYVFLRKNPNIPKETLFHNFLINKNGEITLVGDPVFNKKIEAMLDHIMSTTD